MLKDTYSIVGRWWKSRPQTERRVIGVGAVILAVGATLSTWSWLRDERGRVGRAVAVAEGQVKEIQDDIAELQQLRGENRPPNLSAKDLIAPLSNSLRSARLGLSVSPADGDRLRVHGHAGFDETINWIGAMQRDYRITVISLVATRESTTARFEIVLGADGS